MCLVIAPITIRNWVSYKHFIPLSLGSGITLIEGIGEYDSENKFGLPADDLETGWKEAEWYGNPEYAEQLWKLEGLERDRARFAKGVAVIKSNPRWFLSVVLRRMTFMLRYNDFRQQNRTFNHTIAPTVLPDPNFNHPAITGENAQLVWSRAAAEALPELSSSSETSLQNEANVLHIQGSVSARGDLLGFPFIPVKKQTDYILKIQNRVGQGDAEFKVKTADPRITLAQLNVGVEATRKKKKKQNQENPEPLEVTPPSLNFKQLAFTSADTDEVNLVVSKRGKESEELTMQIDRVGLFEMGPTPYQWTRFPRSIIRGIQKNVYKTDLMRLLIIVGILLLAFIKQYRTLLILLAVPIYYLCIQGILHTEYRYILVIHYFLFMMVAGSIYCIGAIFIQLFRRAKNHS
jgi:hypothetical protein